HDAQARSSPPPAESASTVLASAEAFLDQLVSEAQARERAEPPLRLVAQMGTCSRAVGAEPMLAALRLEASARALDARAVEGACSGMCYAAPSIEVQRAGWPRFLIERVDQVALPALLDHLTTGRGNLDHAGFAGMVWADTSWRGLVPAGQHPFWQGQERVLLRRCGAIDRESLDEALSRGAYRALARALDRPPVELIETVKASGLQGRGGAFFPTAVKS